MLLSGNGNFVEFLGLTGSESSDLLFSLVVRFENLLATFGLVVMEARLNLLGLLLLLLFSSLDLSLERSVLSDSSSFLSSSESSESLLLSLDSLSVLLWASLLSLDLGLEFLDSGGKNLVLVLLLGGSSAPSDSSGLLSDFSGELGFDGAAGTLLLALFELGSDLGQLLESVLQTLFSF